MGAEENIWNYEDEVQEARKSFMMRSSIIFKIY
jgi:hypothetical protein